jgi:glutamate synthase (NADPH/NADH) large chain
MSLYHASDSRDNCGFGLISQLDGKQSHQLIETALEALTRMTHRGAIHSDGKTGDGCGISIQLSHSFFKPIASEMGLGLNAVFGVGQVFLSRDEKKAKQQRAIVESVIKRETMTVLGWREVPVNTEVLGKNASESLPRIEQVFIKAPSGWRKYDVERRLFVARKRAAVLIEDRDFYIVSMSNLMIVYKGLVMPENLASFYLDLQSPEMESAIVIFHQRFSTNTKPEWRSCQPFRFLAHNGEINTISANRSWAEARRSSLFSPLIPDLAYLGPLVNMSGSDSSSLDNMMEIMLAAGMDIFQSLRLLVPPAWKNRSNMDPDLKAFYEFNAIHMEPWDGPAGIVMSNGDQVACTLDRNGLRPARYVITKDRILTVASEVGVWDYDEADIIEKDRVGPGEMLAADTSTGQIWRSHEIDDQLKTQHPYKQWLRENTIHLKTTRKIEEQAAQHYIDDSLKQLPYYQKLFNVTQDEIEQMIKVMAETGAEPVMSMGDDTPVAVLSQHHRNLFDFFRQQFAQVTNPPIDPIREKSVMSLETYFGRGFNIFQQTDSSAYRAIISSPILNYGKLTQLRSLDPENFPFETVSLNYPVTESLEDALDRICAEAVNKVREGCVILHLTDRDIKTDHVPLHPALIMGMLHTTLVNEGLRLEVNIIVETGFCRDPHHFAVLIGLGATAIYPYLAFQMVTQLHLQELLDEDLFRGRQKLIAGLEKGLLKILSKMGISTIASYRASRLFEVLGFDETVMEKCFPGMRSAISGLQFEDLDRQQKTAAGLAWNTLAGLPRKGVFKYVHGGEYHAYNPDVVQQLQAALASGDYNDYLTFANTVNNRPIATLRDLFSLKKAEQPLADEQVEPAKEIQRRFDTAAMSIGALSTEAHEALAKAMNTIGGRSNSGEGGEDASRFGTDRMSKIKQVASGRFGVTAHYLVNAEVLQIKVAQGAKPGEGGQLPGHKVSVEIAKLRHAKPGVTLISPPPHHDIYSIEDLAQLIFDLKQVNPKALVSVKLVSGPGVGTIAAGVAKAYADMITIAGHDGGTGASPSTSVKYAGNPWEIGLAEAHQALIANGLRDKICLQVDGGLKTGLDVIKGAILGADSFGFGTGPMVALGCKYLRICHLNNCATGVATQNKQLRDEHFHGLPGRVITYFDFIAREVRHYLAEMGIEKLDDIIGRTDLLEQVEGITQHHKRISLQRIVKAAARPESGAAHYQGLTNTPHDKGELNQALLKELAAQPDVEQVAISASIKNYDRSVGASISGYLSSRSESNQTVDLSLKGIAGQSLGVWNAPGLNIYLEGDANDYVGKGMSGGTIAIYPPDNTQYVGSRCAIVGNTCLYGATGGKLFAAGQAGERFAVRNSGVSTVVEGIGDHGCEYMTGGMVVILGPVGENFGAGMSDGHAIVLDLQDDLHKRLNEDVVAVDLYDYDDQEIENELELLISEHVAITRSPWAAKVLHNLNSYHDSFKVVIPRNASEKVIQLVEKERRHG